MTEPIAFLNGQFVRAATVAVSPVDSGYVLGAGVAEQLRTFGGKLFRWDDHLTRLEGSLAVVGVDPGMDRRRFTDVAEELLAQNHRLLADGDDLGLSIVVTPGIYPAYAEEESPTGPTVCVHTYALPFRFWASKYRTGQALVLTSIMQVPGRCWPADLKCRSRMHYYLADREAAKRDPGARAVLLDEDGHVTEASTANVLIYSEEEGLLTPPAGTVLPGISASVALRLAAEAGIPTGTRPMVPADLAAAGEVLLTSTPWCLMPVTRFEGRPVGQGEPGPVFRKLLAGWSRLAGVDIAAQAERFAVRGSQVLGLGS
jgi:branched-subunit amino acid aminotransferase/4-amino-4-deoxychorismate lyase